jgi:hypothetical protein
VNLDACSVVDQTAPAATPTNTPVPPSTPTNTPQPPTPTVSETPTIGAQTGIELEGWEIYR